MTEMRPSLRSYSVEWAKEPHEYCYLPAGAMGLGESSFFQVEGSSAFLNNFAKDGGGEKRVTK